MKSFGLAVLASLVSAAIVGVVVAIMWPFLRRQVVGDLKAEVKSQGVVKGATADAVTGLVEGLRQLGRS